MTNNTLSSKNILSTLEKTAEKNKTSISSDVAEAVDTITTLLSINQNGTAKIEGRITTVKAISLNISVNKIITSSHKNVALKAIELLKLTDVLHIEDEVNKLKAA